MFTVKRKHFSDANITNILNIRKYFCDFLKKSSPQIPNLLFFAIKARGNQQANESTSQQVNKLKSDKSDESDRSDKRWV